MEEDRQSSVVWAIEERLRYVKAHRKQDISLVQELWPVHNRGGGVKPCKNYSETSAKIQKKLKRARKTHLMYWRSLYDEQPETVDELPLTNELLTDEEKNQRWISGFDKIIGLMLAAIPKVDGKVVSDFSETARSEAAGWHIDTGGTSLLLYCALASRIGAKMDSGDWMGCIEDCNEAMALLPPVIEGDKYSIIHPKEIRTLFCRGHAHYSAKNFTMAFNDYRCCCAAMRLAMHYKDRHDQDSIDFMMGTCVEVVSFTVRSAVAIKVQERAKRPFFSVDEINLYEKELGIGIFSRKYHKCGNCGMSRTDFPSGSNTCTGCFRVSYCCKECQLADWKIHKPCCREKWRSIPMEAGELDPTRYNEIRATLKKEHGVCMLANNIFCDQFIVCCLDPNTKELFDGWTDRPLAPQGKRVVTEYH